jgi:hypothetical protein
MSLSKKFICKGTLRQVFICLRPRTPYPPCTLYSIRVCVQYTYSHREGREIRTRENGERGNSSQNWVENTNMTNCISSLYTLKNTIRKVPLQVNFLDDDILLWCLYS